MTDRVFKIKKGVRPYSGHYLEAREITGLMVTGHVRFGRRGYATGLRVYWLSELEEVGPHHRPEEVTLQACQLPLHSVLPGRQE